jgi:tRNA modification GTPase
MDFSLTDTIAAVATPQGEGGLAVVRVSGIVAFHIADEIFRGASLREAPTHTLHHGWLAAADGPIDEVVAAVFRAPRSYTAEDVVELSCHGGRLPAQRVLAALLAAGARLARPGEFTLRAFLNGRIDLVQAEAVAELIGARSEIAYRAALSRLAGGMSHSLLEWRELVADVLAEVEARVDFAEDVGGVELTPALLRRIGEAERALSLGASSAAWARALREGVQVAIAGPPNAGKSSLFNRLVGEERAIVTEIAGTTRDRVSATIEIEGALFTLSDTAGLRESDDLIEAKGIDRARAALEQSHVVVWVVDAAAAHCGTNGDRPPEGALAGKRVVVALNKLDLGVSAAGERFEDAMTRAHGEVVRASAESGDGVAELAAAIARAAGFEPGDTLASERQVLVMTRAAEALARARAQGEAAAPGEIVAVELNEALRALDELLGRCFDEDMLDRIFSRFCVGK